MPALSTGDRQTLAATFQSDVSRRLEPLSGVLRADIQAAFNAADDWAVANAASFNSALPPAARTGLTAAQKAALLAAVLMRRYVVGA